MNLLQVVFPFSNAEKYVVPINSGVNKKVKIITYFHYIYIIFKFEKFIFLLNKQKININKMNTFILDFETTGLNPYTNDVIEIAVKKYGEEDNFHTAFVKPKKMPKGSLYTYVPPNIVKLTGITDKMIDSDGILNSVATYQMFKYIVDNSDLEKPIYIVSHNGTTFDFIFFKRMVLRIHRKKKWV